MILSCRNCGASHASLEAVWGAHHGRFRVSIYFCTGHESEAGCGQMGMEVYDDEEQKRYLYGCIQQEDHVPVE